MVSEAEVKKDPAPLYYTLRFRLQKDGGLRYISHLDFVRTMTKALVRSKLPLWYTLGFNPIPKIAFTPPLSVMMDSDCELMDVRMNEPIDPTLAQSALGQVLPPHLKVTEAYIPKNKLSEVGYISYDVTIAYEGASSEAVRLANDFLSSSSIPVEKKGKGDKIREIDLKPMIASATLSYNETAGEIHGRWVLSASSSAFLNPELLLDALRKSTPLIPEDGEVFYRFRRREMYGAELTLFR